MPTRTSSTEPLQNQSTMRWTAFAATRARLGGLVDIGSPIHGMRGVALVFQSSQHGADGRFLEWTGKPLADGLGRHRAIGPNQLHDIAFEVAQFGQAVIHGAT